MKVTFRTNLGSRDAKALGLDHTKCAAGMELDVSSDLAETLSKRGLIEPLVMGLAQSPAIKGVSSPVTSFSAAAAIDQISRMTSKEKLEEIVVNDTRATVQAAAQKRLDELGAS